MLLEPFFHAIFGCGFAAASRAAAGIVAVLGAPAAVALVTQRNTGTCLVTAVFVADRGFFPGLAFLFFEPFAFTVFPRAHTLVVIPSAAVVFFAALQIRIRTRRFLPAGFHNIAFLTFDIRTVLVAGILNNAVVTSVFAVSVFFTIGLGGRTFVIISAAFVVHGVRLQVGISAGKFLPSGRQGGTIVFADVVNAALIAAAHAVGTTFSGTDAAFILSAAAGAVGSFIRYYNFTIREDEKNIRISYGLLNKKDYVLPKEKISGFNFEQSLFMRFAGKGCLYVYAVGYGEGGASTEEPLLMPLVKREDAYKEVSSFLGCDIGSYEPVRPAKNAAPLFFLTFGSAFFISVTAAAFVVSGMDMAAWLEDVWIFAIFLLMYLAGRWLCYLHTAISASDEAIYISSGGYKVKSVFLKMKNVENCESSSSGLKRRLKALNVKIRLFASSSSAVHDIKNVPERVFGMINEKMIF